MKKCMFYNVCYGKRKESITCNDGGGSYCGIYRHLSEINKKEVK